MVLNHRFQSPKADGADQSQVRPSNWNDTHVVNTSSAGLLGLTTTGTSSEIEVITLGSGLSFSGSSIVATASGSGSVSTSGSVSAGQATVFTSSSTISGFTGTGVLYATSGVLSTTSIATVTTAGAVSAGQMVVFTNSSTISGFAATGVLYATSGIISTTSVGDVTAASSLTSGNIVIGQSGDAVKTSVVNINTSGDISGINTIDQSLTIAGACTVEGTLSADSLILTDYAYMQRAIVKNGGTIVSDGDAGNTLTIGAWDVDGSTTSAFITLTSNNTPTCDLASSVTQAGSKIWNATATIPYTGIQTVTASTLLGNPNTSVSNAQVITLGSGLSFSGSTLVNTASGSGTVNTAGSVSAGQLAVFTNTTTISGYTTSGYVYTNASGVVSTNTTVPFTSVTGLYYNAKTYGVVGDGSTDDAAAINSLISTVSTAGGGTIYFPAGNYKVNSTVSNQGDYITLMGDNFGNTRIFTADTSVTVLQVGTQSSATKIKNPGIKNIQIQAATAATATSVCALKMYGVTQPEIYSSLIKFGGTVFYLKNADIFNFMHTQYLASTSTTYVGNWVQGVSDDVTIGMNNNCYFNTVASSQTALLLDAETTGANEFNRVSFYACKFGGTTGLSNNTGVKFIAGLRGSNFVNCAFQYNTGAQFDFTGYDPTADGYKSFINVDGCSLIGTSGTKVNHVINTATSSTANNNIYMELRNCSVQNTTSVYTQTASGSPNLIVSNIDLSVSSFLNVQSGTPRITMLGSQRWGTVTTPVSAVGTPVITQLMGRVGSFITASKGTATLAAGATSTAITFSTALGLTPVASDVQINFTSAPSTGLGTVYISPISTTGFTLNTTATSSTGVTFGYFVNVT